MARAHCRIESLLLDFLSKRGIGQGLRIAVAYSGGPDSTALLAALSALSFCRPIALYVDHGIRERRELEEELALVRRTSAALGADLLVARLRPGAVLERAKSENEGVEAAARRFRYAAFRSAMTRSGAHAVLLAHTMDDQIETVLMRLLGGSGAGGLIGIPEASGPFLRPFLGIRKADLLSYLEGRGIAFSRDSTNSSEEYLRNRIRLGLLPILDSSFPGWRKGLARASFKAAMDEEALSAAAEALAFVASKDEPGLFSAPSGPFLTAPRAVASRSIVRAAGELLGKARFSSRMAAAALDALGRGGAAGYVGGGLEIRMRADRVSMRRGLDFPRHGGYFVVIERPCSIRVGPIVVRASWDGGSPSGIRSDAFTFPLVIRSRRPGDAIVFKDGTKRLDILFSEWALPELARRATPVVEDCRGILAVLGAAFGGQDRFRAGLSRTGRSEDSARRLSVIVKGA
jgi:tRNA(Ile)-lysidine synthase